MSNNYGPRIVTDGLVLCLDAADLNSYPRTGNTVYDLSGNNNTGLFAPTTAAPSFSSDNNGCFVFSGGQDRIYCNHSTTLSITQSITMESWIYPTAYKTTGGNGSMIITKLTYYLELASTGVLRIYFYDLSTAGYHYGNTTVPLNAWSHCVGVRDKADNSLSIYVNGELDRKITSITGNIRADNTKNVQIGSFSGNDYYDFFGKIANSKIYNIALSPDQIRNNYEATKGRFGL